MDASNPFDLLSLLETAAEAAKDPAFIRRVEALLRQTGRSVETMTVAELQELLSKQELPR